MLTRLKEKLRNIGLNISAFLTVFIIFFVLAIAANVEAAAPREKFYDFEDQLIDGQLKKPITLYTSSRDKVKFDRLLKLKKSFLKDLFKSAKEKVFK